MKILLILLAVIVGLPVYAFVGFLVFVAACKITEKLDYYWRVGEWRRCWIEDAETVMVFLTLWPMLVAIGFFALPFCGVYNLIKKLLEREE